MTNQNHGNQSSQNKSDNQADQGRQEGQQRSGSQGTREINPNRPAGEPGKLPQNAGSALDSGKGGTATQHAPQSKSQDASSQSMKGQQAIDERNAPSQGRPRADDAKQADSQGNQGDQRQNAGSQSGNSRNPQDADKAPGIGGAVSKGQDESAEDGEDDLGHGNSASKNDAAKKGNFPGREKGAM